jgi:hypothetical protein
MANRIRKLLGLFTGRPQRQPPVARAEPAERLARAERAEPPGVRASAPFMLREPAAPLEPSVPAEPSVPEEPSLSPYRAREFPLLGA